MAHADRGIPRLSSWRRPLALGILILFLSIHATAFAPTLAQTAAKPEDLRRQRDEKSRLMEEKRQIEADKKREVETLEADRTKLNRNLIETAKAIQLSEAEQDQIEKRVAKLDEDERRVASTLSQNYETLIPLLAAMQRMGANPPPVMATTRDDALKMVRSAMMLAAVYPELKEQALALSVELNKLAAIKADRVKELTQKQGETLRLADQRTRLEGLLAAKHDLIQERQVEIRQLRKTTAELARIVTSLDELVARSDKAVSEQPTVAAYERELAELNAAESRKAQASQTAGPTAGQQPQASPVQPSAETQVAIVTSPSSPQGPQGQSPNQQPVAPSVTQAASPGANQEAVRQASAPEAVARPVVPSAGERSRQAAVDPPKKLPGEVPLAINPGRLKPAVPFDKMAGKVRLPAVGYRVTSFGEKTDLGTTSRGQVVETRPAAQITSPSDGWVVYAGKFRDYGQLLIVNAGGGYHIVLAGLTRIDVTVGQFLLAGEPVGTMGAGQLALSSARSNASAKAAEAPSVLYVEFRKDGRPIDPHQWWAEDWPQRVQG